MPAIYKMPLSCHPGVSGGVIGATTMGGKGVYSGVVEPPLGGFAKSGFVHGSEPKITWFASVTTLINYACLQLFGNLRDFLGR